jgi:hypothetical protein
MYIGIRSIQTTSYIVLRRLQIEIIKSPPSNDNDALFVWVKQVYYNSRASFYQIGCTPKTLFLRSLFAALELCPEFVSKFTRLNER